MNLDTHKVFNPRNHLVDVVTAFTHFTRKYGYVYDGENRTVLSTANTVALFAEWKDQDKARLFLSRAVSEINNTINLLVKNITLQQRTYGNTDASN